MRYVGELGEEIWINMPVSHPEAPSDIERAAIVRAAHRFLQNIQDFLDPSARTAVLQRTSSHVMSYMMKLSQHGRRRSALLCFFHSPTQTRYESWIIFVFFKSFVLWNLTASLQTHCNHKCLWYCVMGSHICRDYNKKYVYLWANSYFFILNDPVVDKSPYNHFYNYISFILIPLIIKDN